MKMAKLNIFFVGADILICVALALMGLWIASGLLHRPPNDPPVAKRVHFTLQPGEMRGIAAYVAKGGQLRFISDSRAAKIRYRLCMEDGHKETILTDRVATGAQRGKLIPKHGSLYEWVWNNPSSKPAHVAFFAEGRFSILDRTACIPRF